VADSVHQAVENWCWPWEVTLWSWEGNRGLGRK